MQMNSMQCFIFHGLLLPRELSANQTPIALLIGNGLACFYLFYLYLTKTSLDIFNCSPTTPPTYNDEGAEVSHEPKKRALFGLTTMRGRTC